MRSKINRKYSLTSETIVTPSGVTLYRIQAEKDFGNVRKGSLGGFVQSEANLSRQGDCWVFENAKVFGNAQVYGNVLIESKSWKRIAESYSGNQWVTDKGIVTLTETEINTLKYFK